MRHYQDHGGDGYNCTKCMDHDESDLESDDEALNAGYRSFAGHAGSAYEHGASGATQRAMNPPAPDSTASSGDGYESFENTNNKKKRKIPQSNGALGSGGDISFSPDEGHSPSGLQHEAERPMFPNGEGVGVYYGSGTAASPQSPLANSGNGISGAGRGRYSKTRPAMDRRPLGVSSNGLNASSVGRNKSGAYPPTKGW